MRIGASAAGAMMIFLAGYAAPACAGNPFAGKDIYLKHCAGCHGERGESKLIGVPNFSRGEVIISSTDPMLLATIKQGKGTMPGFRGLLKDAQLLDVIAYMRTLF
jgi:mono/diheme cytochrome c family protein